MTLGGLALAVGILVDEATVEVENVHAQLHHTDSIAQAVRLGNLETAVPRLLALLCILAVFIPTFVMEGAARGLFAPLAMAVGFAMVTSYVLSSTLVPVLCVWLLRKLPVHRQVSENAGAYGRLIRMTTNMRWLLVPAYLASSIAIVWIFGQRVGTEIFPRVDAGQFQLRLRAPTGTRIEQTEAITKQALKYIDDEVKAAGGELEISLGYVGVVASSYPINAVYLWGGPHESAIRIALKHGNVGSKN